MDIFLTGLHEGFIGINYRYIIAKRPCQPAPTTYVICTYVIPMPGYSILI